MPAIPAGIGDVETVRDGLVSVENWQEDSPLDEMVDEWSNEKKPEQHDDSNHYPNDICK